MGFPRKKTASDGSAPVTQADIEKYLLDACATSTFDQAAFQKKWEAFKAHISSTRAAIKNQTGEKREQAFEALVGIPFWKAFFQKAISAGLSGHTESPLQLAAKKGNLALVAFFISIISKYPALKSLSLFEISSSRGDTALHLAIKNKHTNVAIALIDAGSSIYATDKKGNNALHLSLIHKTNDVTDKISGMLENNTEAVTKINFENNDKKTPGNLATADSRIGSILNPKKNNEASDEEIKIAQVSQIRQKQFIKSVKQHPRRNLSGSQIYINTRLQSRIDSLLNSMHNNKLIPYYYKIKHMKVNSLLELQVEVAKCSNTASALNFSGIVERYKKNNIDKHTMLVQGNDTFFGVHNPLGSRKTFNLLQFLSTQAFPAQILQRDEALKLINTHIDNLTAEIKGVGADTQTKTKKINGMLKLIEYLQAASKADKSVADVVANFASECSSEYENINAGRTNNRGATLLKKLCDFTEKDALPTQEACEAKKEIMAAPSIRRGIFRRPRTAPAEATRV